MTRRAIGPAALLLWVALTTRSSAGGEMDWVPAGARASKWGSVSTPGVELYVVSTGPKSYGVARKDGATLDGAAAFRAALDASGTDDPKAIAELAALLLDRSVREVHAPWTPNASGTPPIGASGLPIAPPTRDGDAVVYWRYADQVARLDRVTVTLDGRITVTPGDQLGPAVDPGAALQQGLAGTPDQAAGAVSAYARSPGADPEELVALTKHPTWQVRQAAVAALAARSGPETGPALLDVLLADAHADVRNEAMRWLRDHPDPTWRARLEPKASDPAVYEVLLAVKKAAKKGGCF